MEGLYSNNNRLHLIVFANKKRTRCCFIISYSVEGVFTGLFFHFLWKLIYTKIYNRQRRYSENRLRSLHKVIQSVYPLDLPTVTQTATKTKKRYPLYIKRNKENDKHCEERKSSRNRQDHKWHPKDQREKYTPLSHRSIH